MNKKSLIILLAVIGVMLVGAGWYVLANQQNSSETEQSEAVATDAGRFKEQYPEVADDNRYVYATSEQVLEVFERGDGLIFLGFPECPWCQQLAPLVDEAAKAEDLEQIYYLDIRQARVDNDETYQQLIDNLEEYLPKDEEGNPRISVPDVTVVLQGKIAGRFQQEPVEAGERVTPQTYWTDERRMRAVDQLRQLIREMQ